MKEDVALESGTSEKGPGDTAKNENSKETGHKDGVGGSSRKNETAKEKHPVSFDEILDELERKGKTGHKYTEGWDPDKLEEELKQHPFFMTEMPKEGEDLPPLVEAFQQLKYSPDENTPLELATNHKEDGLFHFKLKKYRIAISCFTEGIRILKKLESLGDEENILMAQLYNNRAVSQFQIKNYKSSLCDCEEALKFNADYLKPMLKAVECCERLKRWDEMIKFCDKVEKLDPENKRITQSRVNAIVNQRKKEAQDRKRTFLDSMEAEKKVKVMNLIRERNITLTDENFLDNEEVIETGKIVDVAEDGLLQWPVLFFYPQYSESDLIEAFHEQSIFDDHLKEMLDVNKPGWDRDGEYSSNNVDVYFIDMKKSGYVKVNKKSSLLEIQQSESFQLPSNGIPSFVVLSRTNEMCKLLVERAC